MSPTPPPQAQSRATSAGSPTVTTTPSRRRRVPAAGLVAGLALAGCGVTTDDGFNEFGDDELARELVETTTTTTTTTTVPASTTIPGADSTAPTTPTTIVQTQQVDVYFVIGNQLQSQSVALAVRVSPEQVITQLVEGPPPEPASVGLRTVVPNGLVLDVVEDRGVLTIDLRGTVLDRMRERDKPLAIAQLALSLSRTFPGIGQITFARDGVPTGVPVPARDDEVSEPGEGLVFEDFAPLLATTAPLVATTTSTSTTTTTIITTTMVPAPDPTDPPADVSTPELESSASSGG
jgi:hypothetical protein